MSGSASILADREISIGDYVLSGGELGAAVIVDTVTRLIPGAVGNAEFDPAGIVSPDRLLGRYCRADAGRVRLAVPADCSTIRITRGLRIFVA